MKIDFNKKYTTVAFYAFVVISLSVVLVFAFVNASFVKSALSSLLKIFYPIIYGLVLAYLINPIYKLAYNKVFADVGRKKSKTKLRRTLSITCTYIFVFAVVSGFVAIIVPQIIASYMSLQEQVKKYIVDASGWVNEIIASSGIFDGRFDISKYFNISELTTYLQKILTNSYSAVTTLTPYVISILSGVFTSALNWIVGIIISIYLLASKDVLSAQLEKTVYAFMKKSRAKAIVDFARETDQTFGKFILGKILDSLIIGILTFIILSIVGVPYSPLVSLIIGVTNIIPFFGPFIGAIPSVFIVLIAEPKMAIWTLIIIIVIQQLDGNIIGPKIIGNTTGVSSLWIVVSIIVFGGIFGVVGMIAAVPVFAIIYKYFKNYVERKLDEKGMSTNTMDYLCEKHGDLNDPNQTDDKTTKKI